MRVCRSWRRENEYHERLLFTSVLVPDNTWIPIEHRSVDDNHAGKGFLRFFALRIGARSNRKLGCLGTRRDGAPYDVELIKSPAGVQGGERARQTNNGVTGFAT